MSQDRNRIDMLHGGMAKKLILFALPLAVGSLLQTLFNSADLAVVGRFAGPEAMAAVGSNTAIVSLLVCLFVGLSTGANVVISRLIGSGRPERIRGALHCAMALSLVVGVALMALGLAFSVPILRLVDSPDSVFDLSVTYLRIYFLAIPAATFYNFAAAALRSKGDSKRPLYCLIISGVLNLLLNLLFVIAFRMGVAGVAIATVLSNYVAAGLVLRILLGEELPYRLELKRLRFEKESLKEIIRVGLPSGLQGTVFSVSNVVIQSSVNSFDKFAMAGSSAGQNFEMLFLCLSGAFVQAAVTFTSQNYGARNRERCIRVFRRTMLLSMLSVGVVCLISALFRNELVRAFTTEPEVLEFAAQRVLYVGGFGILTCLYEIPGACMRGSGRPLLPTLISVFGTCGFRLIWVYTAVARHHTFTTLMLVYPLSWIVTGAVMLTAYFITRPKLLDFPPADGDDVQTSQQ